MKSCKEEKMVRKFLQQHRQELSDRGFSERVNARLVVRRRGAPVWVCCFNAVLLLLGVWLLIHYRVDEQLEQVLTQVLTQVVRALYHSLTEISPLHLLLAVVVLLALALERLLSLCKGD